MAYFADSRELREELEAFLQSYLDSPEGAAGRDRVAELADSATLVLHVVDPDLTLAIDFLAATISTQTPPDPDIEIELDAVALHDILLERLDPVQISRLYETDRLLFSGESRNLAALVMLAGSLQPFYTESLRRRGRDDLLATPVPETKVAWLDEGPYREVIGKRRPWQRAKKAMA